MDKVKEHRQVWDEDDEIANVVQIYNVVQI